VLRLGSRWGGFVGNFWAHVMTKNWLDRWYFRDVVDTSSRLFQVFTQQRLRVVVSLFIAVVGVLYWWWPGIVGAGDPASEPSVLVIGNGDLEEAQTVVSRRLVEEGLTVAWVDAPESWCELVAVLDQTEIQPTLGIVVSLDAPISFESCDVSPELAAQKVKDSLEGLSVTHSVVVTGLVEQVDPVVIALIELGQVVVDPSDLLAGVDERVDCLWWDDCVPDENGIGYVIVRDSDGLTLAGQQRVARMIVAKVL
jgi:hypothetical protein